MVGLKNFMNRRLRRSTEPADANTHFDQTGATPHYVEQDPSVKVWFREVTPSRKQVVSYMSSLFPFSSWIFSYNLQWFLGDLIAGITVGLVVIPQGMAYAKLAGLPVQFGLYTSFMGALVYW